MSQRDGVAAGSQRSLPAWLWIALAIGVGLVDWWGSRYNLNPDGVSYVEMAGNAVAGGPGGVINGYWSPGYPVLIMPVLGVVRAGWDAVIPVLHTVNLAVYVVSLLVFLRLMHVVAPQRDGNEPALAGHVTAIAVAGFLVIATHCISLGLLTPDFGVMLAVLVTVLCCWHLERSPRSWHAAVGLGLVLGLGYWMKAILLPLNALLLFGLFVLPPRIDRARAKLLLATGIFITVALPLVALVSAKVGRLTMGEVGRLNYAWAVDGVTPYTGWTGEGPTRFGSPVHPPRILVAAPRTLEFATPIRATYPLWFDPSYWYAGIRSRIDLAGQWRVLRQGLRDLFALLGDLWAVLLGMLALGLASTRRPGRSDRSNVAVVLALWSIAAGLTYALVHVEARYLAGFLATGMVVGWWGLARRTPRRVMRIVLPIVVLAQWISSVGRVADDTGGFEPSYRPDYLVDADQLHAVGVARGDPVAMVGDAFEAYAAFGAGSPIIVQVTDSTGFWHLTAAARSALQARLAAIGVKALLANNVTADTRAEGWRILNRSDSSNLGVLILRR